MSHKKFWKKFSFSLFLVLAFLVCQGFVFASEENGTIDTTSKYAWGENIGWINFGCNNCDVLVTDDSITGRAWSSQYGWINLEPTLSGVENDGEGTLSGFAWGSNIGWIDFDGVTISDDGEFLGYATIDSDGSQINFNCINGDSCAAADFKVATDWRPASVRGGEDSDSGGGGSSGSRPRAEEPEPVTETPTPTTQPPSLVANVIDTIIDFFTPKPIPPVVVQVPIIAPPTLGGLWNLLPVNAINAFVFAPLPYEFQILASKFPELANTFKEVGIERFTDIDKLVGVTLNIPGLADELNETIQKVGLNNLPEIGNLSGVNLSIPGLSNLDQIPTGGVGTGAIALIKGLPLANFPLVAKQNLPSEFVFARAGGELVDLNVALSVGDRGEVTQRISTLPGKTLKLVVKPISAARSVTGYFIFKSATPRVTKTEISRESLVASALFSMNDLVEQVTSPPAPLLSGEGGRRSGEVENKLVLSSFEYTDPDHDGIYTADVQTPVVPGEYEVITVIEYKDPTLGTRQMRMITVIDPEGYVYEENKGKETRIPSAVVSLFYLNPSTKEYELWPAKEYQQENPQVTDVRGTYSFLVPEGSYYFEVVAPGYKTYEGKAFLVTEGSGIHENIELHATGGIFLDLDWQTVLLIVVLLLLVYNLYRTNLRDKLVKFKNINDGK